MTPAKERQHVRRSMTAKFRASCASCRLYNGTRGEQTCARHTTAIARRLQRMERGQG